jgi:hypothetical protein
VDGFAEALLDLETGICLWLGAGVTKHVARSVGRTVPDWNALTIDLEALGGIAAASDTSLSNPERLHTCMRALGAPRFRQVVSRGIYGELCAALATFAHENQGHLDTPPAAAFELAGLGWLANPIVNFNIETLTSYLVARPAGACRILPYRFRNAASPHVFQEQESSSDFCRTVYHPHGAVNYGGQAVMTSAEYSAHNGSLAYLLSVSAAFENNLWIVGMSLDDAYLRDHLRAHRDQINRVRWFDAEPQLRKHESWATEARVTLVPVEWPEFWATIGRSLGGQVRRAGVLTAWFHVLNVAMQELVEGGPAQQLARLAESIPDLSGSGERAVAESKTTYRHVFDEGEGARLLPDGFDRAAIDRELSAAIRTSAELVAQIQRVVSDGGGDTGRDMASALESAKPRLPAMRLMNL